MNSFWCQGWAKPVSDRFLLDHWFGDYYCLWTVLRIFNWGPLLFCLFLHGIGCGPVVFGGFLERWFGSLLLPLDHQRVMGGEGAVPDYTVVIIKQVIYC